MTWSCWQRAAPLPSAECCPWRGQLLWAQALRSSANHQLNNTQRRLWRSSSDTFIKTCRTLPRRRNSSDRFTSEFLFVLSYSSVMQKLSFVCFWTSKCQSLCFRVCAINAFLNMKNWFSLFLCSWSNRQPQGRLPASTTRPPQLPARNILVLAPLVVSSRCEELLSLLFYLNLSPKKMTWRIFSEPK